MGLERFTTRATDSTRRALTATRAGATEAAQRVVTPRRFEPFIEEATRFGQWFAAFGLIFIVPVSLTLLVIAHRIMVRLFLTLGAAPDREGTPFAVTLATLALIIVMIWLWFQWVRTAGFGLTQFTEAER